MKKILQLVDTTTYIEGNCFQHQLAASLRKQCNLVQVELAEIKRQGFMPPNDGIISCLKQRTIFNNMLDLQWWLGGNPIVIYDQDPWQSYMNDSPYKSAYDLFMKNLNVRTFALTTKWWVDRLNEARVPATFVKMGILPEYCNAGARYVDRKSIAGFIGSVHPRRKVLIDIVEGDGIKVDVLATNSLSYASFLSEMSKLRCFVHNENMTYLVDDEELNFNTGMWIKDIEAASQGCFSIRGKGDGSSTYLEGIETVLLYDEIKQVPSMVRAIEAMDPDERQSMIDRTVDVIKKQDEWSNTARTLIDAAT